MSLGDKPLPDWHVDPALGDAIEAVLSDLSQEILDAIAIEVPEYARPLEGAFGRGLQTGVAEALRQFVALVRNPDADRGGGREVYVGLGRGEFRQGRSLDSLQAAYRVGARVAWRTTSRAAEEAGHLPDRVYELADAIFAYIDELSAQSVEGYAAAQREREGEREIRRSRLLTALISGVPRIEVEHLAAAAGWQVPVSVAAAACEPDHLGPIARRIGLETLSTVTDDAGCLIVPDPEGPGRESDLRAAASDRVLTLGPVVTIEGLAGSWAEAARAHLLRASGSLHPATGLLRSDESLVPLIIAAEAPRIDRIRHRRLAGLDSETPASRKRLETTLLAWLRNQGAVTKTAAEIGIHPQTVRYRLARLRELLGAQLDEPEARFELELALRRG